MSSSSEDDESYNSLDVPIRPPSRSNSLLSMAMSRSSSTANNNSASSLMTEVPPSISGSGETTNNSSMNSSSLLRGTIGSSLGQGKIFGQDSNDTDDDDDNSDSDTDDDDDLYYKHNDDEEGSEYSSSSTTSSLSVGIQSSFVRRQIEKQKKRGNWNSSIAITSSPPSPALDNNAKRQTSPTLPKGETKSGSTVIDVATEENSLHNGSATSSSSSAAQESFRELNNNDDDDDDDDNNNNDDDHDIRAKEVLERPPALVRARTLVSTDNTSRLILSSSSCDTRPSSHIKRTLSSTSLISMMKIQSIGEHIELHDDIDLYNLEETVQQMDDATAATGGNDDIMTNVSECTMEDDDDDDASLDDNDDVDDGKDVIENTGHSAVTMEDDNKTIESEFGDVIGEIPAPAGSSSFLPSLFVVPSGPRSNNDNSTTHPPSLNINSNNVVPQQHQQQHYHHPIVTIENTPVVAIIKKSTSQQSNMGDSDTFYLQSITSADGNITHASDAPDYDYYSISSSEDGGGESGEIIDKYGVKEDDQGRGGGCSDDSEQVLVGGAIIKGIATTNPRSETTKQTQTAATDGEAAAAAAKQIKPGSAAQKLSREVCGVLGLPKDNGIRKVHRGIMSRDTELRLRKMTANSLRVQTSQSQDTTVTKSNDVAATKKKELLLDDENGGEEIIATSNKSTSSSSYRSLRQQQQQGFHNGDDSTSNMINNTDSSSSSSSSSEDLEFDRQPSSTEKKKDKKWESVRLRRQSSRMSRTSLSSGSYSSMLDNNNNNTGGEGGFSSSNNNNNGHSSDETNQATTRATTPSNIVPAKLLVDSGGERDKKKKKATQGRTSYNNKNEKEKGEASSQQQQQQQQRPPRRIQTRNHQPFQIDNNDDQDHDNDNDCVSSSTSTMVGELKSRFGTMHRSITSSSSSRSKHHPPEEEQDAYTTYNNSYNDNDNDNSSEEEGDGDDDEDEGGPSRDKNILTEGEYYVAMSMLVYIYALLRETSLLGHTDIGFDEIDVNSFQSSSGGGFGTGRSGSSSSTNHKSNFLLKTKSAGFIIRVVMDELEKKGAFSSVEKNEGDMSVLKEFKTWVHDSRSKQLDAATEATIKDLRRKVARRRWKRAINAVRLMVRLGYSTENSFALEVAEKGRKENRGASSTRLGIGGGVEELTRALQKATPNKVPQALSGSMLWMHDRRNHIMSSLGIVSAATPSPSQESLLGHTQQRSRNTLVGESEIKDIINDALEEPRFFIEGSLLSNLIESGIEVVWFGDRHPNDVVYSICCNRQYKRVSVVFRGTVNAHNWIMNMKFAMSEHPNPITEHYPGREDTLGLHTGFSLYMTRQRKDDSLTKIEEIFTNIDSIGRELAPDGDYELSITGHSLGGALATILSFYAATSNVFSKVKTIRVFTYAAPRVGCHRFLHAFQYLERIGKLRHARFTNTRDVVPLIPFHGISRSYKHAGMHIRLHGVNKFARYWLRQALDVTYPKHQDFLSQLWRGFRASLIRNLDTVQGYKRNHTLSEYQRRIRFALDYRSMLAQSGFFQVSRKRSRLKTLDEYYFIRGASNVTCTGELTRISLEDRAKESVRREARKIVIFLLVAVLLEAVILVGVLKKSVLCENYPILLYPFFLLTGCRKEEAAICNNTHELAEIPDTSPHLNFTSDSSSEKTSPQDISKLLIYDKKTGSWTSSWLNSLWKWKPSHSSHINRPPCVWGRCNFLLRPYTPWGVGLQHQTLPSTIGSWALDLSDLPQELIWDVDILFGKEDVHSEVADMVLSSSRGDTVVEENDSL